LGSIGGLKLDWWHVVQVAVEALGVVPMHPGEGGKLDVVHGPPGALIGTAYALGLVKPVGSLRQGVEAPIDVK